MKNLELPRKIPHMINGILYLALLHFLGYVSLFVLGSLVFLSLSFLGIWLVKKFPWWEKLFEKMIREENPIKGIGIPTYFSGMFLACTIQYFLNIRFEILVYAITTLAIGDGIATIVGKSHLGVFKPKGYPKSYSGMIVGTLLSMIISGLFLEYIGQEVKSMEILLYTSIGMIIEFFLVSKKAHEYCIDNFAIPVGIILVSIPISLLTN